MTVAIAPIAAVADAWAISAVGGLRGGVGEANSDGVADSSDLDHAAIGREGAFVLSIKHVDGLHPARSVLEPWKGHHLSVAVEDKDGFAMLLHRAIMASMDRRRAETRVRTSA